MTPSTSAVAVCCSSDSRNSVNSRALSIAMTAWSAKVRTNSTCRSVYGSTLSRAESDHPDRLAVAQQWHRHCRSDPILFGLRELVVRFVLDVGDAHHATGEQRSPGRGLAVGTER